MVEEEVRERWAEYFKDLLNVVDDREAAIVALGDDRKMLV